MKNTYSAISAGFKKFQVVRVLIGDFPAKFDRIGEIREFQTFEEADKVARDLAAGKYPDIRPAGNYISMR